MRGVYDIRSKRGGFTKGNIIKTIIVAAVCICLCIGGLILYRHLHHKQKPENAEVVGVESVKTQDVNIYGDYVGRVKAQQFVEVHARVEGYLEKMLFDEGTFVKKGQPLFKIDPKVYQAKVNKSKALLNKAKAQLVKADRDLKRIQPLYEVNAASRLDLDNAIAAHEAAQADVEVCQADLAQDQLILGYTSVVSPISGYISERNADIGTLVGPSSGKSLLATVVKSDTVSVDFSMTALDYQNAKDRNLNIGHRDSHREWDPYVTIKLPDGKEYPYQGLIDFADPVVDPKTGTFAVRAEMPNPDHILLPGQFTQVRMLLDVRDSATVVPARAMMIEKGGAYVFVARRDSVAEKRLVEPGPQIDGSTIVIERGLNPNEKIVVEGIHKLKHGTRIRY